MPNLEGKDAHSLDCKSSQNTIPSNSFGTGATWVVLTSNLGCVPASSVRSVRPVLPVPSRPRGENRSQDPWQLRILDAGFYVVDAALNVPQPGVAEVDVADLADRTGIGRGKGLLSVKKKD